MMQSDITIDTEEKARCRICWEESGNKISPCYCMGSMAYIHEGCLRIWIEKSLEQGNRNASVTQDGYTILACELCTGEIAFKMKREPSWLKCGQIRDRIQESLWAFLVLLFVIVGMMSIGCVLVVEGIHDLIAGQYTTWEIIFLFCFVIVIFALTVRFMYTFFMNFFRGNSYEIGNFKERLK